MRTWAVFRRSTGTVTSTGTARPGGSSPTTGIARWACCGIRYWNPAASPPYTTDHATHTPGSTRPRHRHGPRSRGLPHLRAATPADRHGRGLRARRVAAGERNRTARLRRHRAAQLAVRRPVLVPQHHTERLRVHPGAPSGGHPRACIRPRAPGCGPERGHGRPDGALRPAVSHLRAESRHRRPDRTGRGHAPALRPRRVPLRGRRPGAGTRPECDHLPRRDEGRLHPRPQPVAA